MHKKVPSSLARAGKVDIRIDEEQSTKLRETIDMLVDAGYFRAKIKGLSPFDKIVGGMTWCIEVCNFDVDVDLLFHDSLSIGQKIALTEQIVKVLPSMKCPHRIEPHQIQGLDAIHIFPVVKWLVTQAAETRAEYRDEIRIIALDEFNRQYGDTLGGLSDAEDPTKANLIRKLKLKYGPKQRFRRDPDTDPRTTNEKVLLTLLEYSEVADKDQILRGPAAEYFVEGEPEDLHQALSQTLSSTHKSSKLSSKSVSAAISEQVKDIADTTRQFQKNRKEEETTSLFELISAVERQKSDLHAELHRKKELSKESAREEDQLQARVEEMRRRKIELEKQIKKYEDTSPHVSKETIEELGRLVEANESTKKRITQFKETCRKEADALEDQIKEVEMEMRAKGSEGVDEPLVALRSSEKERLAKFRTQLAKKTRELETYRRLVDDVPGRAELAQYQRRFVELYNLVGAEHHETLQFYNMYNTLADSKFYMEKELGLLNSILDNMEQGLASPASLGEYICQLDSITEGIKQNNKKLEQKRSEARAERSSLSQELSRLQELQLLYAKHIHAFSQEIAKNEMLLRELDSRS